MKYLVCATIIISTLWSLYAFPEQWVFSGRDTDLLTTFQQSLTGMYKYTLPSVTWSVALVYLYDFAMAMTNQSSRVMKTLYKSTRFELFTLLSLLLFTLVIYTTTLSTLTNLTIDISMAGFGFMLFGSLGFLKLFTFKVGRVKYPWKMALLLSALSLLTSFYFLGITLDIARGKYTAAQSLWYQITILCYSLSLYFFSKHLLFIMERGRADPSPVLRRLMTTLGGTHNAFEQAAVAAERWNQEVRKARAITQAAARKKQKNKKKRQKRKHRRAR